MKPQHTFLQAVRRKGPKSNRIKARRGHGQNTLASNSGFDNSGFDTIWKENEAQRIPLDILKQYRCPERRSREVQYPIES